MARDIIVYLRSEGARSRVVDRLNKVVNSPLVQPSAYYGEYPMVRIRPLKSDGSPYTVSDLDYDVFDFGLDDDKDLDSDPLVYSESSEVTFTVSTVTVDGTEYAEVAFLIDMWTADILALFSASKEPSRLYAEFNAWTAGEERPALTWQFDFYALAKVLPVGSVDPPDSAPELYRLKAAQDAIDAVKVGKTDFATTAATELTISSGAVTRSQLAHKIDTESDAASDDLDTISGGAEGDWCLLYRADSARAIILKHGTGNLILQNDSDYTIPANGYVLLYYDGSNWRVLMSSATGVVSGGASAPFDDGDLSSGVYAFNHGLNQQLVSVVVMDADGEEVEPEKIVYTDANNCSIYLKGWGTITGTWTALAIAGESGSGGGAGSEWDYEDQFLYTF